MVFWAFICYCAASNEAITSWQKKIKACFLLAGVFKETEKNDLSMEADIESLLYLWKIQVSAI